MSASAPLLAFGLLAGCRPAEPTPVSTPSGQFFIRGRVQGLDPKKGTVVLNHEAVVGLMPAMTMEYPLANPSEITELHAGDVITATLLTDKGPDGPTHARLSELDVIAQERPDATPAVAYHVPAPGDLVPNFTLLNQSGKHIRLAQFRGEVVAITFVYTRCPLADYCPRMSRNFADIDKALHSDPAAYAKTHLLTVSFDPSYDTPAVLRSYGGAYTGRYSGESFTHWDFAAPSLKELPEMEHWFGVGVTPGGGNGALQHSLSTLIVGRDGRVLAFYPTNEWTVDEALKAMRSALTA